MLKRKRASCGMLCYTLYSLYIIGCLMLKCQLRFQVPPFLIHGTRISYAKVHLVPKREYKMADFTLILLVKFLKLWQKMPAI